jgi:hypothetical protein
MTATETITSGRIYEWLHPRLSGSSGPAESSERPIHTQVDVAGLLDDADDDAIQLRGSRGAADAHAQIGFDDDGDTAWERLTSMNHPAIMALPPGTPAECRRAIRSRRAEGRSWDGHNWVDRPVRNLEALLQRIRAGC